MNGFVLRAAVVLLLLGSDKAFGQTPAFQYVVADDSLSSNVPLNEISPRAFRHFQREYGTIPASSWYKYGQGYLVRYWTSDSSQYYIYINRAGIPYKTLVYYKGTHVPEDVRSAVGYYDDQASIVYASELQQGQKTLYELCLQEPNGIKIVDLRDGEFETKYEFLH